MRRLVGRVRRVTAHWLDVLLGERCVCGERVFPRDVTAHELVEHAGDRVGSLLRGRCGALLPVGRGFVAPMWCSLAHGHRGWHRSDEGTEWSA
jgi:hypothetical protein